MQELGSGQASCFCLHLLHISLSLFFPAVWLSLMHCPHVRMVSQSSQEFISSPFRRLIQTKLYICDHTCVTNTSHCPVRRCPRDDSHRSIQNRGEKEEKNRDKEGVIGREKRGKEIVENGKGGRKGE